MIDLTKLYIWQQNALDAWINNGHRGIVLAATGTGKTTFALAAMLKVRCRTIIIVPTKALMTQWKNNVIKDLGVPREKVGVVYSEEQDYKPITIAVVNSVWGVDLSCFDMAVLDECHHYASEENVKILENNQFKYIIGLTASIKRADGKQLLLYGLVGPVIHKYLLEEGIKDGILNKYSFTKAGVQLTDNERKVYDGCSETITLSFPKFGHNFVTLNSECKRGNREAFKLRGAIAKRLKVMREAEAKINKAIELVKRHPKDQIIIFNESIGAAEKIYELLCGKNFKVSIYHSKMKDNSAIIDFEKGNSNILVAVKSLNEGLDVKSADVGIIVSATKSDIDNVQRPGRILRKSDKGKSHLYRIYCIRTKEQVETEALANKIKGSVSEIFEE